jgi:hypothetical protein
MLLLLESSCLCLLCHPLGGFDPTAAHRWFSLLPEVQGRPHLLFTRLGCPGSLAAVQRPSPFGMGGGGLDARPILPMHDAQSTAQHRSLKQRIQRWCRKLWTSFVPRRRCLRSAFSGRSAGRSAPDRQPEDCRAAHPAGGDHLRRGPHRHRPTSRPRIPSHRGGPDCGRQTTSPA